MSSTSSNPFSFVGGMFLEIGAAIAVVAFLWSPQQSDARTALHPTELFSAPAQFSPVQFTSVPPSNYADRPLQNPWPAHEAGFAPQQTLRHESLRVPVSQTFTRQNWQQHNDLLPPAPPSFERVSQPEPAVTVARPYVRPFVSERTFSQPTYRTAEMPRDDFHSRY